MCSYLQIHKQIKAVPYVCKDENISIKDQEPTSIIIFHAPYLINMVLLSNWVMKCYLKCHLIRCITLNVLSHKLDLVELKITSEYFSLEPDIKFPRIGNSPELSKMMDLRHTNSSPCRFIMRNRLDVASNMSKISTMPSTHLPWFLWRQMLKSIKAQKTSRRHTAHNVKLLQAHTCSNHWQLTFLQQKVWTFIHIWESKAEKMFLINKALKLLQEFCWSMAKSAMLNVEICGLQVIKDDWGLGETIDCLLCSRHCTCYRHGERSYVLRCSLWI